MVPSALPQMADSGHNTLADSEHDPRSSHSISGQMLCAVTHISFIVSVLSRVRSSDREESKCISFLLFSYSLIFSFSSIFSLSLSLLPLSSPPLNCLTSSLCTCFIFLCTLLSSPFSSSFLLTFTLSKIFSPPSPRPLLLVPLLLPPLPEIN